MGDSFLNTKGKIDEYWSQQIAKMVDGKWLIEASKVPAAHKWILNSKGCCQGTNISCVPKRDSVLSQYYQELLEAGSLKIECIGADSGPPKHLTTSHSNATETTVQGSLDTTTSQPS